MRTFKLKLNFNKFVIKPIIATVIMGVCSYFIYNQITGIISNNLATIIAIFAAVVIYTLAVLALKIFSREEIEMMPGGNKIGIVLEKLKIY